MGIGWWSTRPTPVSGPPIHEIAPDGSGDRPLAGITLQVSTRPSRVRHNGQRWFMEVRDSGGGTPFFPDGQPLRDVLASFEGAANPVPLTNNASQCISMRIGGYVFADWAPTASGQIDGAAAWLGTVWADAGDGSTDSAGGSYATFSINPDGTGLTLLAQGRRAKNSSQTSLSNLTTLSYKVHRMTASGAGNVILSTVGGSLGSHDLGWGG